MPLILASASPRRAELLARRASPSRSLPPTWTNRRGPTRRLPPTSRGSLRRLAPSPPFPAASCSGLIRSWLDGRMLGKPGRDAEAAEMLRLLSGRWHEVLTGVVVVRPAGTRGVATTRVRFMPSCAEADVVCRVGRASRQSGRLRLQGRASRFVDRSKAPTRTSSVFRSRPSYRRACLPAASTGGSATLRSLTAPAIKDILRDNPSKGCMTHKALKIGVTVAVLALALAGLLYSSLSEGTEYYKHVDEVMANPAVAGQAAAVARLRRPRLDSPPAEFPRLPLQDCEQRQSVVAALHRHRSRHLQRRCRGGAQGTARTRRVPRGPERGDGEVPVEVRTKESANAAPGT